MARKAARSSLCSRSRSSMRRAQPAPLARRQRPAAGAPGRVVSTCPASHASGEAAVKAIRARVTRGSRPPAARQQGGDPAGVLPARRRAVAGRERRPQDAAGLPDRPGGAPRGQRDRPAGPRRAGHLGRRAGRVGREDHPEAADRRRRRRRPGPAGRPRRRPGTPRGPPRRLPARAPARRGPARRRRPWRAPRARSRPGRRCPCRRRRPAGARRAGARRRPAAPRRPARGSPRCAP